MILTEEALKDARAQGASDDQILEAYKSSAPQHAKEIESGLKSGAKPGELLGSLADFYKTQKTTPAPAGNPNEGFFGGLANDFREGLSGGLKGAAKTAEVYAGPGAISGTLDAASGVVAPEGRRQSFAQRYKDTTFAKDGISGLAGLAPGLIANSLGDLAPALAGGVLGGAMGPAGAFVGFTGVRAGQSAGDIAQSRATNNGTAEPSTTDKAVGAGAGLALGALDRLGLGKAIGSTATKTGLAVAPQILSQTAKATGQGALTGAVSSAGQQAAGSLGTDKGLQVDPSAVGEAAALGGAAAGGIRAARGVGDVGRAVKFRDLDQTEIARYNARIDETRGTTESPEASAKVLSQVESRLSAETTALSRDVSKQLKSTNPGVDSDTIAAKITEAKATLKKGIELEPKFLEDLARDIEGTNSGPKLLEVLKDFNTHAKVQSKGRLQGEAGDQRFVGGMSSVPGLGALLDPMVALKRYRNTVLTGGGATGLGVYSMPQLASMAAGPAAAATGGLVAAGQALKAVDKATGYRNPLDSVRKLKDPKATTDDVKPAESFVTQKAREAQALKAARVTRAAEVAQEKPIAQMERDIVRARNASVKAARATQGAGSAPKPSAASPEAPRATVDTVEPTGVAKTVEVNGQSFDIGSDVTKQAKYAAAIKKNQNRIKDGLGEVLQGRKAKDGRPLSDKVYEIVAQARQGAIARQKLKETLKSEGVPKADRRDILSGFDTKVAPVYSYQGNTK